MQALWLGIGRFLVRPKVQIGLSLAGVALVVLAERSSQGLTFLASIVLAVAFSLWWLTGRSALGLIAGWLLIAASTAASAIKFKYMAVNLQVVDIGFYLRDPDLVSFLATQMPLLVAGAALFAVMAFALLISVYRAEQASRMAPRRRLVLAAIAVTLAPLSVPAESRNFDYHDKKRHFASSFFASFALTPQIFGSDPLLARLAGNRLEPRFSADAACDGGRQPDIVLVLAESAFPTSMFPEIEAKAKLAETFRSQDGVIRPLRVEIFGGGTITSVVGVLGGLPAREFGWKAPYLSSQLKGRVDASLPRRLSDCGYETAVLSPLPYGFVDEGPFMTSLGIGDYKDYRRMQWRSKQERDSIYFDAALIHLQERRAKSQKPQFLFIITMAAHGPFDFRFDPQAKLAGEPFSQDGEMNEYLRRLALSRSDIVAFRQALGRAPGSRGLLFAEFGDHQPMVTAHLAHLKDEAEQRQPGDSAAYLTYYALHSFGFQPANRLPEVAALDIGFLGATLLESAGLAPGPVFAELLSLRNHCAGRYAMCQDQPRKDAYLKRLLDSGVLRP